MQLVQPHLCPSSSKLAKTPEDQNSTGGEFSPFTQCSQEIHRALHVDLAQTIGTRVAGRADFPESTE